MPQAPHNPTKEEQLAAFLATKGVTVCAPAMSFDDQAAPLGRSRRAHEDALTRTVDDRDHEVIEREIGAERRWLEIQGVR